MRHSGKVICRHWATWLQLPLVLALFSALLGWFGECILTLHVGLGHLVSMLSLGSIATLQPGRPRAV